MTDAEKILAEFVADVDAVGGGPYLGHKWPDLLITYNKAKRVLGAKGEKTAKRNLPVIYNMEPIGVDGANEATGVLFYCSESCRCTAAIELRSESDGPVQYGRSEDYIDGAVCDACGLKL